MVEKKGLKLPNKFYLTKAEKEVLHLIADEFLTIKQIAKTRGVSIQAVYKILKSLKRKGAYNIGLKKVEKVESTFNQSDVRLHGQEFNIKILFQNEKYQKLLKKSNILFLDGNSVRLYKNSIEVYSGQSFYGKDQNEAEKKSLEYWNRFFCRLEHDMNIILIKTRARNIKIVNNHYARGNSEICDNANKNRERIWIMAEEDGKLAYITDDSFGFREDETVHPITAKIDRKNIDKQINDWRINNPPTNSEINENLNKAVKIVVSNQELMSGLPQVIMDLQTQIKSHLALINEYRKEHKKQRKSYENKIRILESKNQKKLGDFF
jgi:DNA-binding MarR family transcriptional regulator